MTTITVINLDLEVQVENGPKIDFSNPKKMQAYGKLDIEVPAKTGGTAKTVKVDLQPSPTDKVKFLLIKPKVFPVKNLTYTISDGTKVDDQSTPTAKINKETEPINLSEPHLYSEGMMTFITKTKAKTRAEIEPKILFFTNDSDQSIAIEILVGRDATS